MKKIKKTMSWALTVALSASVMPAMVLAEEAENETAESIIMRPVDMSEKYDTNNIYRTDANGAKGDAGYAGNFHYATFLGSHTDWQWKNEWQDGDSFNTLKTSAGTEFRLKVEEAESAAQNSYLVFSNYFNRLKNINETEAWTTFDIDDGYYKTLEILANTNANPGNDGSAKEENKYIALRLNYSDGTNEVATRRLNYFTHNFTEDTLQVNGKSVGISSNRSADAAENKPGYIGQYSIAANEDKILESVSVLNDLWYLDDNNAAVKYTDADYTYTYTVTENDVETQKTTTVSNDPGKRNMVHKYPCVVYAMTMTTTQALEKKKEAMFELLKTVNVNVDMSAKYNQSNIYRNGANDTGAQGSAGYAGSFAFETFKGTHTDWSWNSAWTDAQTENTLTSPAGTTFKLKVCDGAAEATKNEWVVFSNYNVALKNINETGAWTTFDVEDGFYKTVELLANDSHFAGGSKKSEKIAVRLDYKDGTNKIVVKKLNYFANGFTEDGVKVNGKASGITSARNGSNNAYNGYITQYSIEADEDKVLESVSILNDLYYLDENNEVKSYTADGGWTYANSKWSKDDVSDMSEANHRVSYRDYACIVYGMTLTTNKMLQGQYLNKELETKINELPAVSKLTYDDKAKVEEVGKEIAAYEATGGVLSTEFKTKYEALVKKIDDLTPVDVCVDMSKKYDETNIYRTDYQTSGNAGYAGAFNYADFKGEHTDWTWDTPWAEGYLENTLTTPAGTKFRLKVDPKTDSSNSQYVVFSNYNMRLNNISEKGEWTTFDVEKGRYTKLDLLANANVGGSAKKIAVRLNYSDGTNEITAYNLTYMPNGFNNDGVKVNNKASGIKSKRGGAAVGGVYPEGYITQYSVAADEDKVLESVSILNDLYYLDENNEVKSYTADGGWTYANSKWSKDDVSNVDEASHRNGYRTYACLVYAMTLTTTKENFAEINADYINEIIEKINSLTSSAADEGLMAEIAEMLEEAEKKGISEKDITNLEKYTAELAYFTKVSAVKTANNEKTATVTFTFDKALSDEVISAARFTLTKDGTNEKTLSATKISDTSLSVNFEHGMDYTAEWCISGTVGYTSFNRAAELFAPVGIKNVRFFEKNTELYNFYEAENGFTVTADVADSADANVILALYNGDTLAEVKTATVEDGHISAIFSTVNMDKNWDLKAFVWNSAQDMKPYEYAKSLKKEYGYDALTNTSSDLTVVYFGDSQTEGRKFTDPLTELLKEGRTDRAEVTAINAGQGGTAMKLGMYRLDTEVIAYDPDVVFIEFFPNDANSSSKGETTDAAKAKDEKLVSYHENVIKRLLALDHVPVIIYMNPMHRTDYNDYAVSAIKDLLEKYDIPLMNFQTEAERLIAQDSSTYSWDYFTKSESDVHFTTEGGNACANWMYKLMTEEASKADYVKKPKLGVEVQACEVYEHPHMISSKYGDYDSNWKITSLATETEGYSNPVTGDAFPGEYMATTKEGAKMTFKFSGKSIMFYTLRGKYGGRATYEIDGGIKTGTIDTYMAGVSTMIKMTAGEITGLSEGEHTITITVTTPNANADTTNNTYFGIAKFLVEE